VKSAEQSTKFLSGAFFNYGQYSGCAMP